MSTARLNKFSSRKVGGGGGGGGGGVFKPVGVLVDDKVVDSQP